jgi:hypothetical protein
MKSLRTTSTASTRSYTVTSLYNLLIDTDGVCRTIIRNPMGEVRSPVYLGMTVVPSTMSIPSLPSARLGVSDEPGKLGHIIIKEL